jgi:hypothetical protein
LGWLISVCTQLPVAGLHESSVQGLPSLQTTPQQRSGFFSQPGFSSSSLMPSLSSSGSWSSGIPSPSKSRAAGALFSFQLLDFSQ